MKISGRIWAGLCLVFCVCTVSAKSIEGNGVIVTRQLPVPDYTKIEFGKDIKKGVFKRLFEKGNNNETLVFNYSQQPGAAGLEITTDENLFPYLTAQVYNGVLRISAMEKSGGIAPTRFIVDSHSEDLQEIRVTNGSDLNVVSSLDLIRLSVTASGGSDVRIDQEATILSCELYASGGSDIYLTQVKSQQLAGEASGGSDLHLKGEVPKVFLKASGGSDVHGYDLVTKEAEVSAGGGSDIFLYVTELISGKASGGSDVHCQGNPVIADVKTSGGSDFTKK
ncbi:MAG: DUF2807 domain-containing protein [Tannerellaceae bacterium]|nr:DUF2807 domain-containing protein [Tannerellaceae bacterium]